MGGVTQQSIGEVA
jgi:RNA-directed DNA polymerase